MSTVFTRARAAKKVIDLMECECGIKRQQLRCDARLASDLGIDGDDTYDLLQVMHEDLRVDMSEFDCHDHITPEGIPPFPMLLTVLAGLTAAVAFISFAPSWPRWLMIGLLLAGSFMTVRLLHRLMVNPAPELTIRDLVLSVEAKRWVSPKQNVRLEIDV